MVSIGIHCQSIMIIMPNTIGNFVYHTFFEKSLLNFQPLKFQLFAIGLFGLGVWFIVTQNHYESILGSMTYITTLGIMIAAGLFSMFVCIFGIIGAVRESRFMVLGVGI